MKSYFISFVVLLLVISYNVILSSKNDNFHTVEKLDYRDNEESLEQSDSKEIDVASKDEDSLDTISTTTFRPVRLNNSSSSPHQRDTKLMNLLAARRSALHQDRFRTHSRAATTGRTKPSTEATSKAPPDARTVCVRNCTKNFTRRTSASCMRQCTNIHRRSNSTTSSTNKNNNNNNNSSEEEKSQKDNNEILFTDESSHGFFVVAKDANDTMNHIPELRKMPGILSGNMYKGRPRNKPNGSVQVPDSESDSYLYFGRKIPSLRPSFLSISTVSDEHPQVFEVSVSQKPPPRPKSANKFNPRDRLTSPFTRKLSTGKLSSLAPIVSPEPKPVTEPESVLKTDKILKPIEQQQNASVEVTTEAVVPSLKLIAAAPLSKEVPLQIESSTETLPSEKPSTVMSTQPEVSTPLIINVIDEDETTVVTETDYVTTPTALAIEEASTELAKVEAPAHFSEDKTNLIIFVNKSMNTVKPSPAPPLVQTTIFTSIRSTVNPPTVTSEASDPISSVKPSTTIFVEPENVDVTSASYENPEITIRPVTELNLETKSPLPKESELTRLNIVTYMLAGVGMIPVFIGVVYLVRSLILKGYSKHDEDFDVCITDQKPISPVKKIDKYDDQEEEEDEESGQYEQCSISSRDEFNRANLRLKSLLGEGNFGKVWKAEADDLSGHIGATRIVAVKTVRSGSSQNDLREEATIMRKLGSHPNVVTLLGACLESEPQMLIMEYAMRGRLLSLLRAARSATNILPASVPGGKSLAPLSPRTLAGFALDIATGMEYIADKRIVHRDLAARNILIDHNGICKICDFGMSTDLDVVQKNSDKHYDVKTIRTASSKLDKFKFDLGERFIHNWSHGFGAQNAKKSHDTLGRRPALPIRWMAPEALQYNEFSIETDVWAFGIVLWEIATLGATPYSNLSGREVVRHVLQGTRPELPKDGRHGFFELMLQCWHKVPSMRPTFREARAEISRSVCKWLDEDAATSDYMDVSGFSEDLEHGMVYFNQRISEFECEI
ncbi:uncharacterized protein LOC129911260 [Episyrphus balteatus]|uniref:uncharacterized protein LOC129911260 n=1 Tax=Episyrphus balteatus TaxID=286459 RepID=UPI0024860B17|nr:uncharacterized protein LOC129911260 [Episyrphus balteatus]